MALPRRDDARLGPAPALAEVMAIDSPGGRSAEGRILVPLPAAPRALWAPAAWEEMLPGRWGLLMDRLARPAAGHHQVTICCCRM